MKVLYVFAAILSLALFTALPLPSVMVQAAASPANTNNPCDPNSKSKELCNPLGTTSIPVLVGRAINIFTGISGSIALLMFVYGGILWIFSGGSEEKISKGKEVMKWATIGLAVMFSAYALVNLVFRGLGAA